jgi:hypothetical protein
MSLPRVMGFVACLAVLLARIPGADGQASPAAGAGPEHVDITWLSVTNVHYRIGARGVLTDGYVSRIPQSAFYGGGGGLAYSRSAYRPDSALVARVLGALGGPSSIDLLLTGHSHFDHSFDTPTWSELTGAPIVGSRTTCYQAIASRIPASRCTVVEGGESIQLADGVTMWVIRWNHSGDSATNPEQHDPVELAAVPVPDPATGGLRPGVAEDFPNGGGGRAFLFAVDGPRGRFSWFYQNSASAADLHLPIVVDGVDHGAPLENLRRAMRDAGLDSVDLWIGGAGPPVVELVLPVIRPKAFLPLHWDSFWAPLLAGLQAPFSNPALEQQLAASGVALLRPGQYMDRWRLDRDGVRPMENTAVKRALGLSEVQSVFP